MKCKHCRDLLSAYLDGELAPSARERVGAHLEICAACRAELESLRVTAGLLAGVEVPSLTVDLAARVVERAAQPIRRAPRVSWRPLLRVLPRFAAAAALLLLALAGTNHTAERLLTAWPRQVAGAAGTQIANLAAGLAQVQVRLQGLPAPPGRTSDGETSMLEVRA